MIWKPNILSDAQTGKGDCYDQDASQKGKIND